jgi:hypothetical protein
MRNSNDTIRNQTQDLNQLRQRVPYTEHLLKQNVQTRKICELEKFFLAFEFLDHK